MQSFCISAFDIFMKKIANVFYQRDYNINYLLYLESPVVDDDSSDNMKLSTGCVSISNLF